MPNREPNRSLYGIAEWYGRPFLAMSAGERCRAAASALAEEPPLPCPFQFPARPCGKAGGVCSLRAYHEGAERNAVVSSDGPGSICITCPHRFKSRQSLYGWVGARLLGSTEVVNLGEIGFLERVAGGPSASGRQDVGRIDNILVVPDSSPLRWCALETQAVYFSGIGMAREFEAVKLSGGRPLFPLARRRPDFRSSGPKRLMPQLQTKVPTLRRWGIKTAVVVDAAFFASLAPMDEANALSSADLAWFIVDVPAADPRVELTLNAVKFTTLEQAIDGLTAGLAVSQEVFEARIREKVNASRPT